MKILFFDLETTGFGFDKCAIIQIGAVIADLSTDNVLTPLDKIDLKMRPREGKLVDLRSLEINNFKFQDILTWQSDEDAFIQFKEFIEKYVDKFNKGDKIKLCGYNNVHFDYDFLRQWFLDNGEKYFGSYFWNDQIDVMCEAARYLVHYRPFMCNFKLGNVAQALGIDLDKNQLHDGLYDIKITYKIFKKIISSNKLFLDYNEEKAIELFNEQRIVKSQQIEHKSSYTDENAFITVDYSNPF